MASEWRQITTQKSSIRKPTHHQTLFHDIIASQENPNTSKTVEASPAELSVLWSDNPDIETVGQIATSETWTACCCCCLVTQLCLTLCDSTKCSPPCISGHGNIGEGCHFLFQGIFPTQGSNPHLLRCRVGSLPLSRQRSPYIRIQVSKMCITALDSCSGGFIALSPGDPGTEVLYEPGLC